MGKSQRIDVNDGNINTRKSINDLKYFKLVNSRWPNSHALYYAQQAAVNLFISNHNKSNENIFSINGPPGTGKTTLLQDVIAYIVTKRVENYLKRDGKIFDNNSLRDDICGKYEILVTSHNNSAIKNITEDLPQAKKINFDYLKASKEDFLLHDCAKKFYDSIITNKEQKDEGEDNKKDDRTYWSFIALTLGKKDNFTKFKTAFQSVLDYIEDDRNLHNERLRDHQYLTHRMARLKSEFLAIKSEIISINKLFEQLSGLHELDKKINTLQTSIKDTSSGIASLKSEIQKHKSRADELNAESVFLNEQIKITNHRLVVKETAIGSFGFFAKIFKNSAFNKLVHEKSSIAATLDNHLSQLHKVNSENKETKKQLDDLSSKLSQNISIQKAKGNECQKMINLKSFLLKKSEDCNINNENYYRLCEENIQKNSLFNKPNYLEKKAQLFKVSIQISEVIFLLNIDKFANEIKFYHDNYAKRDLCNSDKIKLQKAFSAIFYVFPVISTTLASSYTMLRNISQYGTLLCDESGQATPQSLIGSLNRANNALIIGDPLQIKPVFTAPEIVIKILQENFNIDDIYSPFVSSAQQLADNANIYGSFYTVENKKVWVGMPLVVHTRCVNPMFNISNTISYNQKMVLATPPIKSEDKINSLPKSGWINVYSETEDFRNNGSTKEETELFNFIELYKEELGEEYFIISPFNAIYDISCGSRESKLGTVHTFQGQQSDVVFIVLGGKNPGSNAWVASTANILNVAITRAKKRAYIFGDYNVWKKYNYFNVAADNLKPINYKNKSLITY